jgi:kynurenine formamidase
MTLSIVDCTHTVDATGASLGRSAQRLLRCQLNTYDKAGFSNEVWVFGCDLGTHTDSPAHFFPEGRTITDLRAEGELVSPGVVIDVADKCRADPDYLLSVADLESWEESRGTEIPRRAFVCMRTGWSLKFSDEKAYLNQDRDGRMHFPGFGEEAARWLLEHREVVGIGIDTLSLDRGISEKFEVHQLVLGRGKYQVENLNLSDERVSTGLFCVLPFKVHGAQEAMSRVIAMLS